MHGEYKVPGGKLVVVDLDDEGGSIANFRLAGDFFLEPDEALPAIDAAVNGLPTTSDAATIVAAIKAALPADAVLVGFTAESVAVAIRRALAHAADWRDYPWQIIHGEAYGPALQLALDQVLTEEVGAGRRGPTLRIWEWNEPAVVIGSFQSLKNEVDLEAASAHGVEVVRRISGGGAMFMEAGSIITYSIYVPGDLVQGMSFGDSYAYLDEWVLVALRSLGIQASYQPINDITSPSGKIGGAAQKRLGNGAVLHHVTMSYDIDAEKMVQILRIGREKMSDKGTKSAVKRVDPLRSQTGLPRAEIIQRMIETFTELYGGAEIPGAAAGSDPAAGALGGAPGTVTEGSVTDAELAAAQELVATKFSTEAWLTRVP